MPKVATTIRQDRGEYNYFVATLGEVLTPREVQAMWGVSYTSIIYRMDSGSIQFRRAITGGSLLLHRASLIETYGEPVHDVLTGLYIPEHIEFEGGRRVRKI